VRELFEYIEKLDMKGVYEMTALLLFLIVCILLFGPAGVGAFVYLLCIIIPITVGFDVVRLLAKRREKQLDESRKLRGGVKHWRRVKHPDFYRVRTIQREGVVSGKTKQIDKEVVR